MIHGYDDSTKEKVEVLPKTEAVPASDFVLLEGTIKNVAPHAYGFKQFNSNDIGGDNFENYVVISVMFKDYRTWVRDHIISYNSAYYMNPQLSMSDTMLLSIYNEDGLDTRDFPYRVLLKRVA